MKTKGSGVSPLKLAKMPIPDRRTSGKEGKLSFALLISFTHFWMPKKHSLLHRCTLHRTLKAEITFEGVISLVQIDATLVSLNC